MKITSDLFAAFVKCPTKCYLRSLGERGTGNKYADWVQAQTESYHAAGVERLRRDTPQDEHLTSPSLDDLKQARWRLAVNVLAGTEALESRIHALERVPPVAQGKAAQLVPIRFVPNNKLEREGKMLLVFDALALSEMLGRQVNFGRIVHGDEQATMNVKTHALTGEVRKLSEKAATVLCNTSPPDLVLNRHCVECDFRGRCRQKAVEKDDLSLLGCMTTNERTRLHKKGIFTITQLSYTFRPKRPRKRSTVPHGKMHPALKALAIREHKIHMVGSDELNLAGTPVYLDVEGLPDRDFYYLIGVTKETTMGFEQFSFWADTVEHEKTIWTDFLAFLATVHDPVLIHYGSFEATFLKRMCLRYGAPLADLPHVARAVKQSFNLLKFIAAHIYFPTYSNGLKDIGAFIGATWQWPDASGIQSLAWRYRWEETHDDVLKQKLLVYNRDDCQAIRLLTSEVKQITKLAASRHDVDFAYAPKAQATDQSAAIHKTFEAMLASAHADYERSRIYIRQKERDEHETNHVTKRVSPVKARGFASKPGRIVVVPMKRRCQIHRQALQPSDQLARHTMIDLAFTKTGCRKVVSTYEGKLAFCPICGSFYSPPTIHHLHQQIFGHGLIAWIAYQRVALRLPLNVISRVMFDLFALDVNASTVASLVSRVSKEHAITEKLLWRQIFSSSVIHADETKINIRGTIQYVWVFTDGKHVAFKLTETRETAFLQDMLAGYAGTLVSDFYPGYDSAPCKQQKCLVHLIRDLNDDLWKNPFNTEYERFVASVRDLLVPMLQDAERFGLKRRHLHKHREAVDRFYLRVIVPAAGCEITAKYQKRFVHYKESLFRFLDEDGLPWHNNAAERAVRHFAVQRKISGFFFAKGASEYLRLLGIAQTCRFQEKSFLRFLLSGSADVDEFKEPRRRRREAQLAPQEMGLDADGSNMTGAP